MVAGFGMGFAIGYSEFEKRKEMYKQELVNQIKNSLVPISTGQLKEMAQKLMTNYEDGAGVVFNLVLSELETRMSETEYVNFCESL